MRSARAALAAVVPFLTIPIAAASPGLEQPVIGGMPVPEGRWRDTVAVLFGGDAECTGVLIAPTIVLTAGHCLAAIPPQEVLIGTNDLDFPARGERIGVSSTTTYPDYATTYDIGVIALAQPSTIEPRTIATGWARLDIADGAVAQIVGFGAIDRDSTMFVSAMQEAETTITDADCEGADLGCQPAVRPGGELGAGGMGVDTCLGDSGGPLYLKTSHGDYLAGITSRAYATAQYTCQDGGIYVRPDAIVDWIEANVGVDVRRGPEPTFSPIDVAQGQGAEVEIVPNDPVGDAHDYTLATQPQHGTAAVREDGWVRYCADPDYSGDDMVVVNVTDRDNVARRLPIVIPVTITAGTPPAEPCTLEFQTPVDSGGCCSASDRPGGGDLVLALGVGALFVRRRRPRRPAQAL